MRDADSAAIMVHGIPSTLLMTNAAGHLARAAESMMGEKRSVYIFCGSGNNGGDGVAAALYLLRRGFSVRALLVGDRNRLSPDMKEMERRLIELGGKLEDFDPEDPGLPGELDKAGVIVDAIFGTGLNSELRGNALTAVRMINASKTQAVAADIPSGVDADTGRVMGEAVRCAKTVTFSMAKIGHFAEPGCIFTGELEVADIGIPSELLDTAGRNVFALNPDSAFLPRREKLTHKGNYGKLLIIGGSVGYTGAPTISAKAAVMSGAGLVYLGVPSDIYGITAQKNDEAMPFPLACDIDGRISENALPAIFSKLKGCNVCAVGPGLGRSEELTRLIRELIAETDVPIVIDADALRAVSADPDMLKNSRKTAVLTPHEGEFIALGGKLTGDRVSDARQFAAEYECVLVLKGHRTICAFPDGEVYITTTGNPGMAKGGTGDALTGVIAALMGQLPIKQAVTMGVYLHGLAGDMALESLGEYSVTASEIIKNIPNAAKSMLR